MGRFLSVRLKDPQPPSFMVHLPAFPEVTSFLFCHQLFFEPWAADGIYPPSFVVSMSMLPWAIPILIDFFLYILRIPGFWEFQGILVQSLSGLPNKFSSQRLDWASFFLFLYFLRPKTYPFMGLDPLLLILSGPWLVDFGLVPSLKAQMGFKL